MIKLTEKEKTLYNFITRTVKEEGFAPSVRDISCALGWKSTSTVHAYLEKLEEKGLIRKESGKSRALKVSKDDKAVGKIPVVGSIAAGTPIFAEECIEDYISFIPEGINADPSDLFALRVKGESMIEAGIMNGDTIVVEKRTTAENGEIVAALIGDEATVKTFYKENGHFRLQPENHTMEPIIVNEVIILGRVVACLRIY